MMKRIFQHYEGKIQALSKCRFSAVKALVNSDDNSVVVLWMHDEQEGAWYRVFIDGSYCGVDRFSDDESVEDLDDQIVITDHSDWFHSREVLEARVFSDVGGMADMILIFKFDKSLCRLIYELKSDKCQLEFIDSINEDLLK